MKLLSTFIVCVTAGFTVPAVTAESIVFPQDAGMVDVVATYGATGDGVTDDTEAIRKAVEEGVKKGNKRLYFRDGTYLISDSLGLFDAKPHSNKRFVTIQGQSEAGTVFKLKDNCEGFTDADKPKIVLSLYQGQSTGDAMHSYARHFTVDVGVGNAGAVGVRYMTNNVGTIEHVTIRSSDPAGLGAIGLDLRQSQNGPGLIQHITVEGFDHGMESANSFSLVFEHIELRNQRVAGYFNKISRVTMRGLVSENSVPAVVTGQHAQLTLIDAELTGGQADQTAIVLGDPKVFLRDIHQTGYGHILQTPSGEKIQGDSLEQWQAMDTYRLFGENEGTPAQSLRLPIEETPEVPWETDLSRWIKVETTGGKDVTESLQKAIDDGAAKGMTTIYFPSGDGKQRITGPIRVHGSINRIVGMRGLVDVRDPDRVFKGDDAPAVFTFADLASDALIVEQFFLLGGWDCPAHVTMFDNQSDAAIVLKSVGVGGTTKKANPGGRWFIEDVSPSRTSTLAIGAGERVWARQFNPESPKADMIHVDGGQLWVLGLKTEGRATHIVAKNGAKVEVLGGVAYQSWGNQPIDPPMFEITDSDLAVSLGFYHHKTPFTTIVSETRDGQTRTLSQRSIKGYHMPLFRAGDTQGEAK